MLPLIGRYYWPCEPVVRSQMTNIAATDIDNVLRQLAFGPDLVVPLVREVPPAILKRRPAPGVWSAHEHACHLPAVQPLMLERLDDMLSSQAPVITPYEPAHDDPDDALLGVVLDEAMERFRRERRALVIRLRSLTADQWAITAEHGMMIRRRYHGRFLNHRPTEKKAPKITAS